MANQYWFMRDVTYRYDSSSSSLKNWQLKRLGKTFQRHSLRSEEGEEEKRGERMSTQKRRFFIRTKKKVLTTSSGSRHPHYNKKSLSFFAPL